THGIFPFGAVARMHQSVRDFTGGRQNEETFSIEVEAPHRKPFAHFELGQTGEHVGTTFRVVVTDNFPGRFVVKNHAWRLLAIGSSDKPPIDPHLVVFTNSLSNMGRLTVHRHASGNDELFHFAPGTDAGLGQNLVQLGHQRIAIEIFAQPLRQRCTAFQIGQGHICFTVCLWRFCPAAAALLPLLTARSLSLRYTLRFRNRLNGVLRRLRLVSGDHIAALTGCGLACLARRTTLVAGGGRTFFACHALLAPLRNLLTRLLRSGISATASEWCAQFAPRATLAGSRVLAIHCGLTACRHLGYFDNWGCRLAHISHVLSETPWGSQRKGANRIPVPLPL